MPVTDALFCADSWCSATEAVFTVLVSACGVFMFAFIVGSASSSLATKDAMAVQQRNRIETIQHYMRYRKVPIKLQRQVNEYFAYLWTCMRGLGESDVMGSLPKSLRRQLAIALNRKLFLKVELFRKCDESTILALAERLTPSIAVPKEYVLRQGEPVTALYFISRGRVLVLVRTGEVDTASPGRASSISIASASAADMTATARPSTAPDTTLATTAALPGGADAVVTFTPAAELPACVDKAATAAEAAKASIKGGQSPASFRRLPTWSFVSQLPDSYRVTAKLGEYDTFGEDGFLNRDPSPFSVRATTFCDLMVLHMAAFVDVSRESPQLAHLLDPARRRETEKEGKGGKGGGGGFRSSGGGANKLRSVGKKMMLGASFVSGVQSQVAQAQGTSAAAG